MRLIHKIVSLLRLFKYEFEYFRHRSLSHSVLRVLRQQVSIRLRKYELTSKERIINRILILFHFVDLVLSNDLLIELNQLINAF